MRSRYLQLLIIVLMVILLLGGCRRITITEEANPDFNLLAYQLEREVRSSFQSAYNSWLNLERITEKSEEKLEQIIKVFDFNINTYAAQEIIDEYTQKLKVIDQGGEGEQTFPTHEVINDTEIIEQNNDRVKVLLTVSRFYPATEWEGKAYKKDYTYIVSLGKKEGHWWLQGVNYEEGM